MRRISTVAILSLALIASACSTAPTWTEQINTCIATTQQRETCELLAGHALGLSCKAGSYQALVAGSMMGGDYVAVMTGLVEGGLCPESARPTVQGMGGGGPVRGE